MTPLPTKISDKKGMADALAEVCVKFDELIDYLAEREQAEGKLEITTGTVYAAPRMNTSVYELPDTSEKPQEGCSHAFMYVKGKCPYHDTPANEAASMEEIDAALENIVRAEPQAEESVDEREWERTLNEWFGNGDGGVVGALSSMSHFIRKVEDAAVEKEREAVIEELTHKGTLDVPRDIWLISRKDIVAARSTPTK